MKIEKELYTVWVDDIITRPVKKWYGKVDHVPDWDATKSYLKKKLGLTEAHTIVKIEGFNSHKFIVYEEVI